MVCDTTMIDSTGDLASPARLRERMEEDGYLYFSRLVDRDRVLGVKAEILALLREHHIVEADGADDARWSGGPEPTESEWMAVYDRIVRLPSFRRLAASPEIVSIVELVCGEPIQVWEQQLIRVIYPEPERQTAHGVGAHQDGDPKLGYQADRFYTAWVSLMEIDARVGGLALVPGSHQRGLLTSAGAVASSGKTTGKAYGLDPSSMQWATAGYEPGGTVIFYCRTVHRGLPNHSDRLRLSGDFRYQPTSESSGWLAHTLGPDVRRVAQAIDETLARRALYVTERPTPEMLGEIRQRMLQEKDPSLKRARALAHEVRGK